jgi:glycosyltransferase involved in cell wall biosynthesis
MPDFQHRHLPGYFSAYESWRRDRNVETAAATGHLLVSSQSAATDFHRFYPHRRRTRVHVLRFTPHLGQEVPLLPKQALLSRYALRDDFFFLPNQFWRHKNHRIVLEALRRLPDHVQVVATGAVSDSRGDAHIRQLLQAIDSHALQQKFRMLGLLPRQEMLSLMRHARCVINPSLFEGWSTVVEEAKFFGKRLILSDIPVHREQAAVDALYFDPHDAGALAIAMETALREHDPRAEAVRAGMAQVAFGAASSEFAARYRSIAESVALDR